MSCLHFFLQSFVSEKEAGKERERERERERGGVRHAVGYSGQVTCAMTELFKENNGVLASFAYKFGIIVKIQT